MTYLITGGAGQLGTELSLLLENNKSPFIAYNSEEMNILNKKSIEKKISTEKPTVVFHCAAYTAVDKAEDDDKELNWVVNVEGTRNVAEVCKSFDIPFVYVSTDYVFDGQSSDEFKEDDDKHPLNQYGKAKLAGERVVLDTLDKYWIIRTSWVFGEYGNNFVFTMKKLAEKYDELTVIDDQIGRPTWTRTLAEFMLYLVEKNQPFGTYHLSNEGSCSWYEFAKEILKDEPVKVQPIKSKDYPQKAERPKISVMNLDKSKNTGFVIPHWKEALNQFKENIKN